MRLNVYCVLSRASGRVKMAVTGEGSKLCRGRRTRQPWQEQEVGHIADLATDRALSVKQP